MIHHLEIEEGVYGLELRLACTATPNAPCRKRPADPNQESWNADDPALTDGHECWAVEWAREGGWESVVGADGVEWPHIPVTVEYDEGVVVAPVAPEHLLPIAAGGAQ